MGHCPNGALQLPARTDTIEETPLLKAPTVVWLCGITVNIRALCCSQLVEPGSITTVVQQCCTYSYLLVYIVLRRRQIHVAYIVQASPVSLQVLLYSCLPLQQQQQSVLFTPYSILHRCFTGVYVAVHVDVQQLVLFCGKKLPVRHLFLTPSLLAPVRTAAVYVPVSTYAAVYPTYRSVIGCCPVYVLAVVSMYRQHYVREQVSVEFLNFAVE